MEVSMMSSHLVLTSRVRLEQILHMFGYLKKHHSAEMLFDPIETSVDHEDFKLENCFPSVYGKIKE